MKSVIKIGCCGFPRKKALYFRNFDVVEIQRTFYQLPEKRTALKWRDEKPCGFEYTLKAWQLITHPPSSPTYRRLKTIVENKENYGFFKATDEVLSAWKNTSEIADILGVKIIVFQTPISFKPEEKNIKNVKRFFKNIDRKDFIFCFEPRGDWDNKLIEKVCRELDLVHCVDPFRNKPVYGKINYFRIHGINGYNYKYTQKDLEFLKRIINEISKPTYVMFNNVYMYEDALEFKNKIMD
jgi:uncharacterized protein YecE (DUF72 family)